MQFITAMLSVRLTNVFLLAKQNNMEKFTNSIAKIKIFVLTIGVIFAKSRRIELD